MKEIIIEKPKEVQEDIIGARVISFQVLPDKKDKDEEPFCADKEILINFNNGKEMRIYIDDMDNLSVYTD